MIRRYPRPWLIRHLPHPSNVYLGKLTNRQNYWRDSGKAILPGNAMLWCTSGPLSVSTMHPVNPGLWSLCTSKPCWNDEIKIRSLLPFCRQLQDQNQVPGSGRLILSSLMALVDPFLQEIPLSVTKDATWPPAGDYNL
jgi:hypothetical protein